MIRNGTEVDASWTRAALSDSISTMKPMSIASVNQLR